MICAVGEILFRPCRKKLDLSLQKESQTGMAHPVLHEWRGVAWDAVIAVTCCIGVELFTVGRQLLYVYSPTQDKEV